MNSQILKHLNAAEESLRENLHRNDVDPVAREHMERAMSHVREASVATIEIGKARSVQRLVSDAEKMNHLLAKIRRRQQTDPKAKSIRV